MVQIMSFDLTHVADFSSSLTLSDDGTLSGGIPPGETPTSTLSTAFDSSAFGSGSSVLSTFEPPTDGDSHGLGQTAALTHFLEDPSGTDTSLVRRTTRIALRETGWDDKRCLFLVGKHHQYS